MTKSGIKITPQREWLLSFAHHYMGIRDMSKEKNTCFNCGTPPVTADPNHEYYVCDRCNDVKSVLILIMFGFMFFSVGLWIGMYAEYFLSKSAHIIQSWVNS
jgi:hypothetical protein